jgi:uncharacterized protein
MASGEVFESLAETLKGVPGVVAAYLFGSSAEGRTHRESDVDIAVLVDRARYPAAADRFELRLRLFPVLRQLAGREVDVVILNDAPPQLARRIMTTGRTLTVNDREAEHAHRRLVLSRAADLEPFLRRTRRIKLQVLGR